MSSLPRSVEAAGAAADQLYEQMYKQQPEAATPAAEQTAPTASQPVESPAPGEQNGIQQSDSQQTPAPAAHPEGEQGWEHRYKVLSGKYNSEVPRLAAENRELKSSVAHLQSELKAIKEAKPAEPLLKPEEIEEYGEGLIDVVRRAAREELASKDSIISELQAQLQSLTATTARTVEVNFYEELTKQVPDWNVINDDPQFHVWLDGRDELTGERRQDLLSQAEAAKDYLRVANFFSAFKKASQQQAARSSQQLEAQIAPEAVRTIDTPKGKRHWTKAEIRQFYSDARSGRISESDYLAIEADIMAAQLEGRVS